MNPPRTHLFCRRNGCEWLRNTFCLRPVCPYGATLTVVPLIDMLERRRGL